MKKSRQGKRYTRPANIAGRLENLVTVPLPELVKLVKIRDTSDPHYVPNECLLYFIRLGREEVPEVYFKVLFDLLMGRVIRMLSQGIPVKESVEQIIEVRRQTRAWVVERLVELISGDRHIYNDRLDFYEIRFNRALACLRRSMFKKAVKEAKKVAQDKMTFTDLGQDPETGELSPEVERASGAYDTSIEDDLEEKDCRLRLEEAINDLPPKLRTVVTMIRQGFVMHSQDPNIDTIAKELNKSEKTIRNYRDQAQILLKNRLFPEGHP